MFINRRRRTLALILTVCCFGVILPGFLFFGWMRDVQSVVNAIDAVVPEVKDTISLNVHRNVLIFGNKTGGWDADPSIREKRDFIEKVLYLYFMIYVSMHSKMLLSFNCMSKKEFNFKYIVLAISREFLYVLFSLSDDEGFMGQLPCSCLGYK